MLFVAAAVLAANGATLLHLVTTNPLVVNAALTPPTAGWLPGLPYIDGNAGFTAQALGHLAALDWLHGHVPWWNSYEGVGTPLAGEMQSGAFFPPTLLLVLHNGVLWLQLTTELVSGWSTYFLVRRLGVGRSFATAAGIAFGLCGTLAWLNHAPIRPVALLPLCLLGVEHAIQAARNRQRGGWELLAVALALSILAGFPETTLLDGLFVLWWTLFRVAESGRDAWRGAIARVVGGGAVGIALSAPLLVAFADYLPYGYTAAHSGAIADAALPSTGLAQLVLPYSLGPIFGFRLPTGTLADPITELWMSVGGFLSVTVIAAGLVGLLGTRLRILRIGLGAWILVCLLRSFGFPPVVHLMAVIPGVRLTAFYRYADPSWELAAVLLAALGMDDIARLVTRRRVLVVSVLVTVALIIWAAITAWPLMHQAVEQTGRSTGHPSAYPVTSAALALGLVLTLLLGGLLAGQQSRRRIRTTSESESLPRSEGRRRRGRLVMAGVVAGESVLLLGFTLLSAPTPTALQLGSVHWLQAHLGGYRFVTLGPITPNYGSYFGIAEVNINDIPVPKTFNREIATRLDPNALPAVFSGGGRINPAGPTPAQELASHLPNYEAIGVRYVVESATGRDVQGQAFPQPGTPAWPLGPRLVYRDTFSEIWQLPSAEPVFALRVASEPSGRARLPSGCSVRSSDWDRAVVRCDRPTTLVRRVQYLPGWKATYGDQRLAVQQYGADPSGLFQSVQVPAGTAVLRFTYLPPHEGWAGILAGTGLFALAFSSVAAAARRRRRRSPVPRQRQIDRYQAAVMGSHQRSR